MVVAVFQEDTFYTPTLFFFTFKTKLRHLNKKWYPGGVELMHTVVRHYRQLTLKYQNKLFASRNTPLCYL